MLNPRIKRASIVFVFATCVLGQALTSVFAQEPDRERRAADGQNVEGLMQAYVISKLQESLDLTDEKFAQMVVQQKKLWEHRRLYRRDRNVTLQQMRQLLKSSSDEEKLGSLLNELNELQTSFESQQRADYESIDAILDIRQRARYRILEQEIQRRFQQMIREVRGRQNPRQPRPQR